MFQFFMHLQYLTLKETYLLANFLENKENMKKSDFEAIDQMKLRIEFNQEDYLEYYM